MKFTGYGIPREQFHLCAGTMLFDTAKARIEKIWCVHVWKRTQFTQTGYNGKKYDQSKFKKLSQVKRFATCREAVDHLMLQVAQATV